MLFVPKVRLALLTAACLLAIALKAAFAAQETHSVRIAELSRREATQVEGHVEGDAYSFHLTQGNTSTLFRIPLNALASDVVAVPWHRLSHVTSDAWLGFSDTGQYITGGNGPGRGYLVETVVPGDLYKDSAPTVLMQYPSVTPSPGFGELQSNRCLLISHFLYSFVLYSFSPDAFQLVIYVTDIAQSNHGRILATQTYAKPFGGSREVTMSDPVLVQGRIYMALNTGDRLLLISVESGNVPVANLLSVNPLTAKSEAMFEPFGEPSIALDGSRLVIATRVVHDHELLLSCGLIDVSDLFGNQGASIEGDFKQVSQLRENESNPPGTSRLILQANSSQYVIAGFAGPGCRILTLNRDREVIGQSYYLQNGLIFGESLAVAPHGDGENEIVMIVLNVEEKSFSLVSLDAAT